jgi:hypothetical protein
MGFPGRKHDAANPAGVYLDLRRQVLRLTPDQLPAGVGDEAVLALLMETRYPTSVVTLAAVADGTTSLYFSTGGGIIGAGTREAVSAASRRWLEIGAKYLPVLPVVTDPPLPADGEARFIAVTPGGLQAASTAEADLRERRHPLWPLYLTAQDVITQIRLTS